MRALMKADVTAPRARRLVHRPWRPLLVLTASCALAGPTAGSAQAVRFIPAAGQPPQLQALEQKMALLRVDSERYAETVRGVILGGSGQSSSGQAPKRPKRFSESGELFGEFSLSRREAEVYVGKRRRLALVIVGRDVYECCKVGAKGARRRWMHRRGARLAGDELRSYPFHGSRLEVQAGGRGSYAGLINLLATAVAPATVAGPVVVDGQPTLEFEVTVEPAWLVKGLTVEDAHQLELHPVIERLAIFLTAAGLPVRVVANLDGEYIHVRTTTQILATEIPVVVRRPPFVK